MRGADAGFCISPSILLEIPNWRGVGQLCPIKAVIVKRGSCAEQSQVFVSPREYFLRLPTGVELGSYPLYKLLLWQDDPARSGRRFFISSLKLLETPNRGGVGHHRQFFSAYWTSVVSLQAALLLLRNWYTDILRTAFPWELRQNPLFLHHRTQFEKFSRTQDQVENMFLQSHYPVVQLNLQWFHVHSSQYRTLEFFPDVFFLFLTNLVVSISIWANAITQIITSIVICTQSNFVRLGYVECVFVTSYRIY